jgi:tRNA threonylcarbamoyladenosine modification (KEOPS) complex  Pcc1 subunit
MKRNRFQAEAEVRIYPRSRTQKNAIAASLTPETVYPAAEKAQANIVVRRHTVTIRFRARDSSTLRAIMSSYLRMAKATTSVCQSLLEMEHRRRKRTNA